MTMTPEQYEALAASKEAAQADAELQAKTPDELRAMAAAGREAAAAEEKATIEKNAATRKELSGLSNADFEARWKAKQDATREANYLA